MLYFQSKKMGLKHKYSILYVLFSTEKKTNVKWCISSIEEEKKTQFTLVNWEDFPKDFSKDRYVKKTSIQYD